jgi:Autographiviridae endonuclease VII
LCAIAKSRARIIPEPARRQACPARVALVASAAAAGFCARSRPAPPAAKFTDARHMPSLEQLRKRYAEDEEFRRKKIAYACAYQKAHYKEIRARRSRRRKADPAYRQKLLAVAKAYYEAHKDELTAQLRRRRQTDPEHRDKLLARERKASHARHPMTRRKHRLRCVYGLSLEEYDAMLECQGGVCAICKKKPDEGKVLFVDHCHVTGMVRGLLCHKCNTVLAFGCDDPDILRAAIAYLQAAGDRDRNVTAQERTGKSARAMRPPDIVADDAKPYDSGVT